MRDFFINGNVCDNNFNCVFYTFHATIGQSVDVDEICDKIIKEAKKKLAARINLVAREEVDYETAEEWENC